MKYEQFPPIGTRTNRFIIYSPDDSADSFQYQPESARLSPVTGPKTSADFNAPKIIYPPHIQTMFDCCADFEDYRRNSSRGRRRSHALQLAAIYRNRTVAVFEKWISKEDQQGFHSIITKLRGLCQGTRISFTEDRSGPFYYQVNKSVMESINRDLEQVYKRTCQVNPERPEDVPEVPIWSDTSEADLYEAIYTPNDWEILASTYRQEVETFLLAMLYLNYDFMPVEVDDDALEDDGPDDVSFVPKDCDPEVLKILEDSMTAMKSSARFKDEVFFSPEPNTAPLPSVSPLDHSITLNKGLREPSPVKATKSYDKFPSLEVPKALSRPTVSFAQPVTSTPVTKPSSLSTFAPWEPTRKAHIVPDYQAEQFDRVYRAPEVAPKAYMLDTDDFNQLFNKPHRYAQPSSMANSSLPETPGVARNAHSAQTPGRSVYSLLSHDDPSSHKMAEGAASKFSQVAQPVSYPFGSISGNPPLGPPGSGSPGDGYPNRPPGGYGPPSGYPSGYPPSNGPPSGPPGGPPGGGPPSGGPPNPFDTGHTGYPSSHMPNIQTGVNKWVSAKETHFDTKLKPEIIPTWDGDDSTILRWMTQLDELSQRSTSVFIGMGDVVPTRFRDRASAWWYSLPVSHCEKVSVNWEELKKEIQSYWMNRSWVDKTQVRALEAKYREPGHSRETPTEYYIRKLELLKFVYKFSPTQMMTEILKKAPRLWGTVLNPRAYPDLAAFQTAIKYNEDLLIELGEKYEHNLRSSRQSEHRTRSYRIDSTNKSKNSRFGRKDFKSKGSRTYAVGIIDPNRKPAHPKDDSNVSKGKTPEDYGARGCLYCGSTKHWDRDCKYFKNNNAPKARTLFLECSSDEIFAEAEYEQCYLESQEDIEEMEDLINLDDNEETELQAKDSDSENQQDF